MGLAMLILTLAWSLLDRRVSDQQMMDRVQKRVLNEFLDSTTTPHTQLAHKEIAFTSVVEQFQDIQSSQEIADACLALQRAMD